MSNMSYCRFQNTAPDVKDCLDNMENIEHPDERGEFDNFNDKAEWLARLRFIKYCVAVAESYGDEIDG